QIAALKAVLGPVREQIATKRVAAVLGNDIDPDTTHLALGRQAVNLHADFLDGRRVHVHGVPTAAAAPMNVVGWQPVIKHLLVTLATAMDIHTDEDVAARTTHILRIIGCDSW